MHSATHIKGTTRLYGLVGDPLTTARSPELFNELFVEQQADAVCVPFAVKADDRESAEVLGIRGDEELDILGLEDIKPQTEVSLVIKRKSGALTETKVLIRIDTPTELEYFKHGGILPYVVRNLLAA